MQVLYPEYAAGKTGVVLAKEMLQDGTETGYWLVKIDCEDMILALLPHEVKTLKSS